jgi:hypothetical protein
MKDDFLVDTYETECIKVVSVWSEFGGGKAALPGASSSHQGESVSGGRRSSGM